ncbi:hypothetical protein R3P38DRAFT_163239 [Favolaschia claudopus]|uniref:Securin n=1 Tax=Favolaschia claudopus TaxID=2862362 RepID=A0AAW0CYK1_9AGAR
MSSLSIRIPHSPSLRLGALSPDITILPAIKAGSASIKKRFLAATHSHHAPQSAVEPTPSKHFSLPECTQRPALKRCSSDTFPRRSSADSDPCPPVSPSTPIHVQLPSSAPLEDDKQPIDALHYFMVRVKHIHLLPALSPLLSPSVAPSSSRRPSHVLNAELASWPAPDLEEVSLAVEPEVEEVVQLPPGIPRKVRFVVPSAPAPPAVKEEKAERDINEEPAWCDFM